MSDQNQNSPSAGLPENVSLLIAYLFSVLGGLIIYFAVAGDNKNLKFHAMQSILIGLALIAVSIILTIIVSIVPFLWFLSSLYSLCVLVVCIALGVLAYQGKTFEFPVVAPIAHSIADK